MTIYHPSRPWQRGLLGRPPRSRPGTPRRNYGRKTSPGTCGPVPFSLYWPCDPDKIPGPALSPIPLPVCPPPQTLAFFSDTFIASWRVETTEAGPNLELWLPSVSAVLARFSGRDEDVRAGLLFASLRPARHRACCEQPSVLKTSVLACFSASRCSTDGSPVEAPLRPPAPLLRGPLAFPSSRFRQDLPVGTPPCCIRFPFSFPQRTWLFRRFFLSAWFTP